MIYTLGYSGWTRPAIRAQLDALNHALLVDIRFRPWSRNPGFTQHALKEFLGDDYLYVHELGNPNYRNGGPIALADPERAIAFLAKPYMDGRQLVLMCGCPDAQQCHRKVAAELLAERWGDEVTHLVAPARHTRKE